MLRTFCPICALAADILITEKPFSAFDFIFHGQQFLLPLSGEAP